MKLRKYSILFASLALASIAGAQTFDSFGRDTRTLVHDISNVALPYNRFNLGYTQQASDGPVFINSLEVVGGSNWNPDIELNESAGTIRVLGYVDGVYSDFNYHLGDALSGDLNVNLEALTFYGQAGSAIENGIYDFTLIFIGGANASDANELGALDLKVEVVDGIGVEVTAANGVISTPDGMAPIDMTVRNTMADRDFVSTTHYIAGYSNGTSGLAADFLGNWFDQTIAPGDSRTDGNSVWRRNPDSGLGTYTGHIGVIGGLYLGDDFGFRATPFPTIDVQAVPEPASIAALCIGSLGLLRRRRMR